MKVAFLKGTSIVDRIIQIWTWGKYSHAELVFSDGTWFSTDLNLPFKTSFHRYNENARVWDFIEVPLTPEDEQKIRTFCAGEVGCSYDWKGIFFSMIIPFNKGSKEKWFCSEVCVAGIQQVGKLIDKKPCTISPNKLAKLLKASGFKSL